MVVTANDVEASANVSTASTTWITLTPLDEALEDPNGKIASMLLHLIFLV